MAFTPLEQAQFDVGCTLNLINGLQDRFQKRYDKMEEQRLDKMKHMVHIREADEYKALLKAREQLAKHLTEVNRLEYQAKLAA